MSASGKPLSTAVAMKVIYALICPRRRTIWPLALAECGFNIRLLIFIFTSRRYIFMWNCHRVNSHWLVNSGAVAWSRHATTMIPYGTQWVKLIFSTIVVQYDRPNFPQTFHSAHLVFYLLIWKGVLWVLSIVYVLLGPKYAIQYRNLTRL